MSMLPDAQAADLAKERAGVACSLTLLMLTTHAQSNIDLDLKAMPEHLLPDRAQMTGQRTLSMQEVLLTLMPESPS